MSSLSSGSLPRNASITDSTDSSNDSLRVRTIRQLPLPAVPGRVSDAVTPPVPAPHTAAVSPFPLSSSLTAVQHTVGDLRPVPVLTAQGLQLNAPVAADLSVAHIPRPSLPLPLPPQVLVPPMSHPTPSAAGASSFSSSSPVAVPASTPASGAATVVASGSQAVLSVPSVPQAPASSAASGLAVPSLPPAVDTPAPAAASMDFPPPLPPPLRVPAPTLPVHTTASFNGAVAATSFSLSDAYATTSLLPQAKGTAASASAPAALPVALPPSLVTPPPGNAAAAAPTNSTPEPAAAPSPSVPTAQTKPRHLRRTRDVLERAECPLFTSPDRGSASTSASSSDSDEDDEAVYVGRTRRFDATAARESERCSHRDGDAKDGVVPQDALSHRHRSRSSHSNQENKKRKHGQVVRMHEVEGKSAEAASREKTSVSSQSTNALTPDKVVLRKREGSTTATGAATRKEITEPSELQGEADTESDTTVPLAFTSPAARFAYLCDTSVKNKGFARHTQMRRLTPHSPRSGDAMHGGDGDVEVEEDDDEAASSDHAGAGMVRFRITGAFSDVASDSKVLGAPSTATGGGGGKQSRTQRESGEAQRDSEAQATVLALTVRGMSPLHADPGVVHPFVRIWIVSCVTGQSLVHASAAVPCAVAQPFDLRAHRTRAPWWEAKVALRLSPERLRGAASDAMVLLEVLDFGNETIHGFPQMRTGLYPICWGFLMLRDCTGRSTLNESENQHVQLFRYPQRTPWYLAWLEALLPFSWSAAGAYLLPTDLGNALGRRGSTASGVAPSDVPSVYHVFQSYVNRKLPYEGTMIVSLRQQSAIGYVPDTTDMLPYEEYLLSMLVSGGGSCAVPRLHPRSLSDADEINDSEQEARAMRARLASSVPASPWAQAAAENYYRMDGERSLLPHDVLQTTAVVGVVTCVAFAHNGTLFALGVYRSLQYLVELRNPLLPDMAVVATLLGHTAHLHRVVFQKEDRYLLSCSSDGTVRVWQPAHPNSPFTAEKCVGRSSVQCVCTLPHGFPLYAAIFHQEKIIAGGFSDQLLVWSYDRPLEGELNSLVTAEEESALHLTATFTPEFQTTQNDDDGGPSRPARVLLGELIYRVDNAGAPAEGGEPTITLSLASNERSNRVWSVHANGAVVCWRAVSEAFERGGRSAGNAGGSHNWQMSVRHRADCDGASEVQVCGSYAIVVCASAPLIFVFDATTCEQLRVVNTHLPPSTPVSLLPDGEAFVGAVGDQSKFVAWECFDGGLCTPATGYARASPVFGVARMSWAESQQLAVLVSRSPCSEEDMVRFVRGPATPVPGQSAAAFYYAQQEEQYRLEGIPAEMTLLTVAGTVRRRATVIQNGEGRASGAFCAMFGGDLRAKRKAEYLAQRTQASRQQETERNSRRARLHQEAVMADPTGAFAAATTVIPHDATEKGARMNAIINFWRGLVGQHKHRVEDLQRVDSGTVAAETPPPPRPFTHRALQYLDADGNETEV